MAEKGGSAAAGPGPAWEVRLAGLEDVTSVASAVRRLLDELEGTPSPASALESAARLLIATPSAGAVLVAESEGALVGVLATSWQLAIHVPGSYALIQDVWVHPAWRGRAVGGSLVARLVEMAEERNLTRIEVGLPRESFRHFGATEGFYLANDFAPLGPRMRRRLS